jgi:hypothetical protein
MIMPIITEIKINRWATYRDEKTHNDKTYRTNRKSGVFTIILASGLVPALSDISALLSAHGMATLFLTCARRTIKFAGCSQLQPWKPFLASRVSLRVVLDFAEFPVLRSETLYKQRERGGG